MIIITGCPRSGTSYMTHLLRELGFSTSGEKLIKADVLVAWQVAGQKDYIVEPTKLTSKRNLFLEKIMDMSTMIFHQVRDPLKVILSIYNRTSTTKLNQRAAYWKHICNCIEEMDESESAFVKSIKFWYYWNLLAEKISHYRYRIEDIDEEIYKLFDMVNSKVDSTKAKFNIDALKRVPSNFNTSYEKEREIELSDMYRDSLSWMDIRGVVSEKLYDDMISLAKKYGYEASLDQTVKIDFT